MTLSWSVKRAFLRSISQLRSQWNGHKEAISCTRRRFTHTFLYGLHNNADEDEVDFNSGPCPSFTSPLSAIHVLRRAF
eukprot:6209779-Pleurochrysis_carterae.AAC.3